MTLLEILDRPIAYHRCFVNLTGTVTRAVLLSQAVYWQNRVKSEDGWWWKTHEEWETETGLTRREIDSARKSCRGFIEHRLRGIPAKSWYRVDVNAVSLGLESCQTSLAENAKLDVTKAPNSVGDLRQTTNSTEITSEIKEAPIPESLKNGRFLEAWGSWLSDRRERKKKVTFRAATLQLKKLELMGADRAVKAIEHSIASGYQGIYEPNTSQTNQRNNTQTPSERRNSQIYE